MGLEWYLKDSPLGAVQTLGSEPSFRNAAGLFRSCQLDVESACAGEATAELLCSPANSPRTVTWLHNAG